MSELEKAKAILRVFVQCNNDDQLFDSFDNYESQGVCTWQSKALEAALADAKKFLGDS